MSPGFTLFLQLVSGLYILLFCVAAVSDLRQYLIPNSVVISLAVLFFATAVVLPIEFNWLSHLGAFALLFALGLLAYRFKVLGAGDVKLIAVGSLWTGFAHLSAFLLYTFILGALLAVLLWVTRLVITGAAYYAPAVGRLALPRVLHMNEGIPYGVAIAAGAVKLAFELPHVGPYVFG